MKLYPETYQTTDGIYDRSHRLWTELVLVFIAYPVGLMIALVLFN